MSSTMDEIISRLRQLNESLHQPLVRGCLVWHDDDLGDDVAEILYGLPAPVNDRWDTAELDRYCTRAAEALQGLVAYSYCDFRSESEADAVLNNGAENWTPVRPLANA